MKKCYVYSHRDFEKMCSDNGWNDSTVENLDNTAFISILCSPTSKEALFETVYRTCRKHWFSESHPNVCNIRFDDCEVDIPWKNKKTGVSGVYKAITEEQGKELYEFIKRNIGKDFHIHCSAGVSRSQAVGRFIREFWPDEDYVERKENPCMTPNSMVETMLKRAYRMDV